MGYKILGLVILIGGVVLGIITLYETKELIQAILVASSMVGLSATFIIINILIDEYCYIKRRGIER